MTFAIGDRFPVFGMILTPRYMTARFGVSDRREAAFLFVAVAMTPICGFAGADASWLITRKFGAHGRVVKGYSKAREVGAPTSKRFPASSNGGA